MISGRSIKTHGSDMSNGYYLSASFDLVEIDPSLTSVPRIRILLDRVIRYLIRMPSAKTDEPGAIAILASGLRGYAISETRTITIDVVDNTDAEHRSEVYMTITGSPTLPEPIDVERAVELLTTYFATSKIWFNRHSRFNRARDLKHFSTPVTIDRALATRARVIIERHRLARTPSGSLLTVVSTSTLGDDLELSSTSSSPTSSLDVRGAFDPDLCLGYED